MRLINKDNKIVNLINFMSSPFREFQFIGFIPTAGYGNLGVNIDNVDYVACHIGKSVRIHSDNSNMEQKQIEDGYHTLVLFRGNDNTSYIRRYKENKFEVIDILNKSPVFKYELTDLFINT